MTAYAEDLTYIHDAGYGGYARRCAPGILQALAAAGIDSGRIVELGCGGGILLEVLQAAGYTALGVDQSPEMIALARRRAPMAQFVVSSYIDAEIPACCAVLALGEVFNYRFDRAASPASLKKVLQRVHAALASGGLFIFDIAEPGRGCGQAPSHRVGDDWACLVDYQYDEQKHRLTRQIVAFRRVGNRYRRSDETHQLQLYSARAMASELREIGFKVRIVRRFGDFDLFDSTAGIIARKP